MWYGEFATGTIIRAEKQNEHRNPFREWPRYGAADNCIICRFNWKYKTPCTHHYGRLWYTSWRLMRRGTSHVCRGICASFKYHSTFRNLIGLHLSGWSNRWLRLPFQAWRTAPPHTPTHPHPFPRGHFLHWTVLGAASATFVAGFLAFIFFHSVHLLYSSNLVLYRLCDYINTIFHLAVGEPARRSTWTGSCRLPVYLHTLQQQSVMLYQ